jgi:uncharacterized membrane protein YtjA (UPF0391 family)
VLATLQGRPSSAQRSGAQPNRAQASKTTTAGRCRSNSLRSSLRVVVIVPKRVAAGSPAQAQATDLYLPRSRVRMGAAAGAAAEVAAPLASSCRARVDWGSWNSQSATPRGLQGFFRRSPPVLAGVFGLGSIAGEAAWVAKALLVKFVVLFMDSLIPGRKDHRVVAQRITLSHGKPVS